MLFKYFDHDGNGMIDFNELLYGLKVLHNLRIIFLFYSIKLISI